MQPGIEIAHRQPEHGGNGRVLLGIVRQPVGLCIFLILQRMLHPAQQPPGIEQLLHIAFIQQLAAGQPLQGFGGAAFAQRRILPTAHDLEHLRAEFDFADAAASQLHVEAGIVALGAAGFGFHGFGADQVV